MRDSFRELNRAAHLARRDAAVERAVEALCRPVTDLDVRGRLEHVAAVRALLETAASHADLAARSARTTPRERDFRRFLDLVLQNVQSLDALVRNQAHFESEKECFLTQFLGSNTESAVLTAVHSQRRSEALFHGLWQVLRMALEPYRALQGENRDALSGEELERYRRGYARYREAFAAAGREAAPNPQEASGI